MARYGFQGRHTFQRRWLRERQRSPEIAAIPCGNSVSREYHGSVHTATCCDGYWLYNGVEYPTLYTVAMAITGAKEYERADKQAKRTMSNWSAVRFFKLREGKKACQSTSTDVTNQNANSAEAQASEESP